MFCPRCGAASDDNAVFCIACGTSLPVVREPAQPPVRCVVATPSQGEYASLAVISLIFGILTYVMCILSPVLSIGAVVCGHLAMSEIKREPGRYKGYDMAKAGLWLGYIAAVLLVVPALAFGLIGLVLSLLQPR